jgi:iron complex outermembrane recepter protein
VRFVGSTFANQENTLKVPSYTLGDAEVHYERDGFRLAVNATSLSDAVFATCSSDIACFYGQRRTILTSLRYRW